MGLTPGQGGGGDYMTKDEWLELARESALIAVVVTGHGTTHMTKGPSAGKDVDSAQFDLFILDGARKGETLPGQDSIGRGIVAPLSRVAVGDEVAYRVAAGSYAGNAYPQLNAPGDLPQSAIQLFEELKSGNGSAPTEKKEPATAGAKSGGAKASKYDQDLPDF